MKEGETTNEEALRAQSEGQKSPCSSQRFPETTFCLPLVTKPFYEKLTHSRDPAFASEWVLAPEGQERPAQGTNGLDAGTDLT